MTKDEADSILSQEQVIAQVLAIRDPEKQKSASKSWREIVFETTGGVALITVLLGGILGGAITTLLQYLQKRGETEHAEQQARLERERATRERIEQLGLDATKDLFGLMYEAVSSSEDVIQLSKQAFAEPNLSVQRREIRSRFNNADQNWRSQRNVKGLMFVYYNRFIPGISEVWDHADKAVTGYLDCSGDWVEAHPFYTQGLAMGCGDERKKVDESFLALERTFVSSNAPSGTQP